MEKSNFNFYFEKDDNVVLYNTFSKGIAVMDFPEFEWFNNAINFNLESIETKYKNTLNVLLDNGFIVDNKETEMKFLKYFHYKTKFSKENLSLTIAPTLECNFACPYCYETSRTGRMSDQTQISLVDYIENRIKNGTKNIDITWYGGEPLICSEIIDQLSSKFNNLSKQYKVKLGMNMVTNGYLLNESIVSILMRNNIKSIQITLDGLSDNHNSRRFLKGGYNTFEKIVDNLKYFNDTDIKVNIRMNVDKFNASDFPGLKRLIESLGNSNISVYPSLVEKLNDRDENRSDYYMSNNEFEKFIIDKHSDESLCDGGIDVIDNRRYFCSAELDNSFVVDEQGNFYKCWDEIGNLDNVCFNVNNLDEVNYDSISKYLFDDPFSDNDCKICNFLPICFGGCRFKKFKQNKVSCNVTEKTLIKYLESKYF